MLLYATKIMSLPNDWNSEDGAVSNHSSELQNTHELDFNQGTINFMIQLGFLFLLY